MGNLLGSPVTEKETHEGATPEGAVYGVSSMQGWRVHMEDAHITEPTLYASEPIVGDGNEPPKYNTIELPGHSLFAVFDGHGGTFAAAYSGRNLCRVLSREPKFVEYAKFEKERPSKEKTLTTSTERANYIQSGLKLLEEALCDAFVDLDREIALALKGQKVADADEPFSSGDGNHKTQNAAGSDNHGDESMDDSESSPVDSALRLLEEEGDSGTTACIVVLTPEWIICANAGDSRSVMSKLGNKVIPLSYDHKPDDENEERRIRAAGGYVAGGRVEGDLAVSRGLGDFRFKNMDIVMAATKGSPEGGPQLGHPGDQKVSPIPDIIVQNRNPSQDEFVIVACDGIWDVQSNYEAVKMIGDLFQEGEDNIGLLCEEVSDAALASSFALSVRLVFSHIFMCL